MSSSTWKTKYPAFSLTSSSPLSFHCPLSTNTQPHYQSSCAQHRSPPESPLQGRRGAGPTQTSKEVRCGAAERKEKDITCRCYEMPSCQASELPATGKTKVVTRSRGTVQTVPSGMLLINNNMCDHRYKRIMYTKARTTEKA